MTCNHVRIRGVGSEVNAKHGTRNTEHETSSQCVKREKTRCTLRKPKHETSSQRVKPEKTVPIAIVEYAKETRNAELLLNASNGKKLVVR